MMSWLKTVLCFLLVSCSASVDRSEYDLSSEVQSQIDSLKKLVQSKILTGHASLETIDTEFTTYSASIFQNTQIKIQVEEQSTKEKILEIKNLATSAGYDVSVCSNQGILDAVSASYIEEIQQNINDVIEEEKSVIADGVYFIDIFYNQVNAMEFQLVQCANDLDCMSPILTQIQLSMIKMPQKIVGEIRAVESLIDNLKINVEIPTDASLAEYISQTNIIFVNYQNCVNTISS